MIRRYTLVALVVLAGALAAFPADSELLLRVERKSPEDLVLLLGEGIPVIMELNQCLLVTGGEESLRILEKKGYGVEILDHAPSLWDYYQIGTHDVAAIEEFSSVGTVLYTEEGWVLLRVFPGAPLGRIFGAQAFVTPIQKKALRAPRPFIHPKGQNLAEGPENADPLVQKIVAQVDDADINSYWTALVPASPGTRYSTAAGCSVATTYCRDSFSALGLATQTQAHTAGHAPNVIATTTGAITPSEVYLVVGHVDDMPSTGFAPGADDNASGTVVVLTAARAMSCSAFKSTVKYLVVTGEEFNLYGSRYYAADAVARGEDIRAALNFDMVAYQGNNFPNEDMNINYNANSQSLADFYSLCATNYGTGLLVKTILCPNLTASDHSAFWEKGYPSFCAITDNQNMFCVNDGTAPYYHTVNDTIPNAGDKSLFRKTVRTAVAALSELAEPFKITFDKSAYACGDTLQIVVGDRDLNTNPATVQTVQVALWSTTETTPETVTLTEENANSMIFRGTIPVNSSVPANGDGVLSATNGDLLTAQYVDALDCDGATSVPYSTTATFSAVSFPGISSVTSPGTASCGLSLAWSPVGPGCGGSYTYSIYRSTTSGFTPTLENRIVSGVTGNSFTDTFGLVSGMTYSYIVRAADAATGAEEGNTVERSGIAQGPLVSGTWTAGAESGNPALTLGSPWQVSTTYKRSGTSSYFSGYNTSSCAALVTPPLTLGMSPVLTYYTIWSTETGYDGGLVQITENGGATWVTLTPSPNYPSTITSSGNACGIATGTRVYIGNSTGYPNTWVQATVAIPAAYEGKTVQIRWRFGTDSAVSGSGSNPGWYIDDISITKTQIPGACATLPQETAPGDLVGTAQSWGADKATHSWPANSQATTGYKVLRGTPSQLPDLLTGNTDHCVKWTGTALSCTLNDTPNPGSFYWYLVLGTSAGGDGHPGSATAGIRSVQSTGSCPP